MRINARIDEKLGLQLQRLSKSTGQSITEVIIEALEAWTREHLDEGGQAARIFSETGFVGAGTGPRDLARNAKRYLAASMKRKA